MKTVEARIRNTPTAVAEVQRLVVDLAAAHSLPPGVAADLNVALDEVLSNIIKYGYAGETEHEICVRLTVADDSITVEVEDDGRPFDPLSVPAPDLHGPIGERKIGGLGIHFLRTIMSDVTYSHAEGRNRLSFRRSLKQ